MRRIKIILFWLFKSRNNISLSELIGFLLKPRVKTIGEQYIKSITSDNDCFEVEFSTIQPKLFWPRAYPIDGIYQVTAETFDKADWHYYQKNHTKVDMGEVLVDVGAAEGLFALSVVDSCKRIFMIEPNALFVKALHKTFHNYSNKVTIIHAAAGSSNESILINEDSLISKVGEKTGSTRVSLKTIDSIFGDEKITFLKADIEGFEFEMLKGAEQLIKRCKPKIAITSYHKENNAEEIIQLVKGFVPEYKSYSKGIFHEFGKPVMIHFWV